jgi:arylsulfatase A
MRWPGTIPAGQVCHELAATIDILPTMARLIGVELPTDRKIDGLDIWPLVSGQPGAKTPHEAYYYYWGRELQAVRGGAWKLHFPHKYFHLQRPGADGQPGEYKNEEISLALFNLNDDLGETTNVAAEHPDVVRRLEALADQARSDLGDSLRGMQGQNVRQPGRAEN